MSDHLSFKSVLVSFCLSSLVTLGVVFVQTHHEDELNKQYSAKIAALEQREVGVDYASYDALRQHVNELEKRHEDMSEYVTHKSISPVFQAILARMDAMDKTAITTHELLTQYSKSFETIQASLSYHSEQIGQLFGFQKELLAKVAK